MPQLDNGRAGLSPVKSGTGAIIGPLKFWIKKIFKEKKTNRLSLDFGDGRDLMELGLRKWKGFNGVGKWKGFEGVGKWEGVELGLKK